MKTVEVEQWTVGETAKALYDLSDICEQVLVETPYHTGKAWRQHVQAIQARILVIAAHHDKLPSSFDLPLEEEEVGEGPAELRSQIRASARRDALRALEGKR